MVSNRSRSREKRKKDKKETSSESESSSTSRSRSRSPSASSTSSSSSVSKSSSYSSSGSSRSRSRSGDRGKKGTKTAKEKHRSKSRSKSKSPNRRRKRSLTPKSKKINIRRLTKNVNKEHVAEVFSVYGTVKSIDMPTNRHQTDVSDVVCCIEFESPHEAEEAVKHMDGGMIDKHEISVKHVPIEGKVESKSKKKKL